MNHRVRNTPSKSPHRNLMHLTMNLLMVASLIFAAHNARAGTDKASTSKELQGYTAKKNISLEALIKEVYAGSPLSNQILGKALHEANPKNLNGKLNQTIKRGQVIFLPDHASVVTQTLTPYALPTDASESANSSSQSSDATSRRLWVRYP